MEPTAAKLAVPTPTIDWRSVYLEHASYIAHSLLRLGIAHADIEDRTHDVFLAVQGQLSRYDRSRPLRPWLFAFAFRVARNHQRRVRARNEDREIEIEELLAGDPNIERRVLVWQLLAKLPVDERAAIILHDLDGHTVEEVARTLECHRTTATRTLARAHETLAQILEQGALR